MAKEYYHGEITDATDWGGDRSTGGLQVAGERVQEWIKNKVTALESADANAEKNNPSVFGGFVDNVTLKNTDAGSDYVKVVYDITRHMFFAVTLDNEVERYHRQYDKFAIYNDGEFPNATPYTGKVYVCGADVYLWDGEALSDLKPLATEESVRAIVSSYEPEPEPESEVES